MCPHDRGQCTCPPDSCALGDAPRVELSGECGRGDHCSGRLVVRADDPEVGAPHFECEIIAINTRRCVFVCRRTYPPEA